MIKKLISILKLAWSDVTKPSPYAVWSKAFDKLQDEKKRNGMSSEYRRIWNDEVCPAYRVLTNRTPKAFRHPLTDRIIDDMDKPVGQRKHF